MAEYVRHADMPDAYRVICTSDWHVGSRAFHDRAADHILGRLADEPSTFALFGGDAVEGKRIDSDHFNPQGLDRRYLNIDEQFRHVAELWRPVAPKLLAVCKGNHDIYLSRDYDVVRRLCEDLGRPEIRGGYQTWVDLGAVRVHMYHGRAVMPRGAKDPIQREANQRAWLVNRLSPMAGDCHVQLMGHVHALLIQPPVQQYALLSGGENVRAHYFMETPSRVGRAAFIPPLSRWYACTGTLRRSGGFGYEDYSEIAGYAPSPIGYVELTVEGGAVAGMRKVVL